MHVFCLNYRIVVSISLSLFEAHAGLFRLLMKGIIDPYVLCKLISDTSEGQSISKGLFGVFVLTKKTAKFLWTSALD